MPETLSADIIERAKTGDERAFQELVEHYPGFCVLIALSAGG